MASFPLKIVTPDGLIYDGMVEKLIVRTHTGDMAVLARHINCVCPLGMGRAVVEADGQRRTASCIGGMMSVFNGAVSLVPTTFEWAEDIDVSRAESAQRRAEASLKGDDLDAVQRVAMEARLRRSLVRQSVVKFK